MKQGDKGSRILAVSLLQNKQPYEIPTGCTARIKYYKPDGNPVLNDCTLSGNEILVTYTEQMLAAAGVGKGEIVLLKGGKELKSATYYTKIVETVYKTDGFVSDKEFLSMGTIFNDMDRAAQAAAANAKIAETAAAAANQAANSANGATSAANSAAEKATSAATKATEAAGAATTAAGNANSAVTKANEATTAAKAATEAAQTVADNVSGIIDEKIMEAFFGSMRNGKIYQTELYLSVTNPTSDGTKTLANAGKVCEPSTDTVEGQDDYEGIGIFTWFNCNYVTNEYGRKVRRRLKVGEMTSRMTAR